MLPYHSQAVRVLKGVQTEVGIFLLGLVARSGEGGLVPPGAPPALCLPHKIRPDAPVALASDPSFPILQGLEAHKYKSTWDCAYQIMKYEGPLA